MAANQGIDFSPLTNLGTQAMQLGQMANQMRSQDRQDAFTAVQTAGMKQQQEIAAIALKKAQEEEAHAKRWTPVSESPVWKSLPIEAQTRNTEMITKGPYGAKVENGIVMMQNDNLARYLKDVTTNGDMMKKALVEPLVNDSANKYLGNYKNYEKVQAAFKEGKATPQDVQREEAITKESFQTYQDILNAGIGGVARANMNNTIDGMKARGEWGKIPESMRGSLTSAYQKADEKAFQAILDKATEIEAKKKEGVVVGPGAKLIGYDGRVIAEGSPKEQRLQLVGHTANGQPVNFNPDTGKQEVGGVEYTGPVKPRVEMQPTFVIQQTPNGMVAINNRDPSKIINLGITKPITAAQQDSIESILTLKDSLEQVRSNYDKSFVGPAQGRLGGLAGTVGIGTTPKEQQFRAQTAELNRILYALSGKQINEQEMKRLEPFIPNVNDSDVKFQSKITEFGRNLETMLKNKVNTARAAGSGVNIPAGAPTNDPLGIR